MENEKKKKQNPPYLPVGLLDQFFKKAKTVNVPYIVDIKMLKSWGIANHQEYFLISALGFLGLIDDELKPTADFTKIQMEGLKFKDNLREIIKKSYSDIFAAFRIEHLTYEDLINFFGENYSQRSKHRMAKAFIYLCKLAEIESPAFKDIEIRTRVRLKDKKPKPSEKPAQEISHIEEPATQSNEMESSQGEWREYNHPLGKLRIKVEAPREVVYEFINFLRFVVLGEGEKNN